MILTQQSVNSDWLFYTQSRVQQADWFILENIDKATLNININIEEPRLKIGMSCFKIPPLS